MNALLIVPHPTEHDGMHYHAPQNTCTRSYSVGHRHCLTKFPMLHLTALVPASSTTTRLFHASTHAPALQRRLARQNFNAHPLHGQALPPTPPPPSPTPLLTRPSAQSATGTRPTPSGANSSDDASAVGVCVGDLTKGFHPSRNLVFWDLLKGLTAAVFILEQGGFW